MNSQIDTSIPVLTEIIPVTPVEVDGQTHGDTTHTVLVTEEESPTSQTTTSVAQQNTNASNVTNATQEEWQQMEQNLHEAVLRQVLSRIDFVLEHRVRDSLADVLQTSVDRLADELRAGLHKTLDEIITRAITQEISKITSGSRGRN